MIARFALCLVVAAVPATAQISFDDGPVKPAQPHDPALDKMVCKVQKTVGSRLNRDRVCATLREWQEQEEANREAVLEAQLRNQENPKGD